MRGCGTGLRASWPRGGPCAATRRPSTRHGLAEATTDRGHVAQWSARRLKVSRGPRTDGDGVRCRGRGQTPVGTGLAAFERARHAGLTDEWACIVRIPGRDDPEHEASVWIRWSFWRDEQSDILISDVTRSAPSGLLKQRVERSVHRQLTVRVAWAGGGVRPWLRSTMSAAIWR